MALRIGDLSPVDLGSLNVGRTENDSSSIGNAIKRQVGGGLTGVGRTARELGFIDERLTETGKSLQTEAGPSPIQSLGDIVDHPGAALREGVGSVVGSAPIYAGMASGAALGAPLGLIGSAVGGVLGGAAVGIPTYFGSMKDEQDESGVQKSNLETLGYAGAESALDTITGGMLGKALPKKLVGKAAKELLTSEGEGFTGNILTRAAKGIGTGFAGESTQEGAQRVIERTAAGKDLTSQEALGDIGLNAALGGIGGGVIGGPLGAMYKKTEKQPILVPGLEDQKSEFTNSDIKATYQRMQDLFKQRVADEDAGKDVSNIDAQLDKLKGHLDTSYLNPPKNEQGVSKEIPEVHKQEADSVNQFYTQARNLLTQSQEQKQAKVQEEAVSQQRNRQVNALVAEPKIEPTTVGKKKANIITLADGARIQILPTTSVSSNLSGKSSRTPELALTWTNPVTGVPVQLGSIKPSKVDSDVIKNAAHKYLDHQEKQLQSSEVNDYAPTENIEITAPTDVEHIDITAPTETPQQYLDNQLAGFQDPLPEYDVEELNPPSTEGISVLDTPNLLRQGIPAIDYTEATEKLNKYQKHDIDEGVGKKNLGYKTSSAAKSAQTRANKQDTHSIVETSEGFFLRPTDPKVTVQSAEGVDTEGDFVNPSTVEVKAHEEIARIRKELEFMKQVRECLGS
jgi:hypothetical protein